MVVEGGSITRMKLPAGKKAAIYFTIDDIHPGTSDELYEAGGDLSNGVLGHVEWLLSRHPRLKVTLFVTADWRETFPYPTRRLLSKIPYIRDQVYLSPVRKKGSMSLLRHRRFVDYLNALDRVTVGLHGLHHVSRGPNIPVELLNKSAVEVAEIIYEMIRIFEQARLNYIPCFAPPGWECNESIVEPLLANNVALVMAGRDVLTDISPEATVRMSGLKGVSLIYPETIFRGELMHLPSNFHSTSSIERAHDIIACGGIVGVKAHIIKKVGAYIARDGLDELYRNYLDVLLFRLEDEYGDDLWWTDVHEFGDYQGKKIVS